MKILVLGESCEDIFIYGESKRLSPEAPVPVFIPHRTTTNPGMAGNVLRNIKALTNDFWLDIFCQPEKIKKTRLIDEKSNHMFIRIDEGEENIKTINLNNDKIENIKESDIVIVSDYNKGFLDDKSLIEIGKNSRLSILDSKKKLTEEIINSFTFIKVNEHEYINNNFLVESNPNKFIVTLGMNGCMYDGEIHSSPSPKQTMDVSGAGDTFTASFILKYYQTKDINQSIRFANEMASIVVSKRGVSTPEL
jgi:bifunctional ADP-heptose synthase (sugar kinase/adenylyltransferase)